MAPQPTDLGLAIKKFRTDLKFSRAEFAKKVGITGNSVYRYEAGLSQGDINSLRRLLGYAIEIDNRSAVAAFSNELRQRVGPESVEAVTARVRFDRGVGRAVHVHSQSLSIEDNLLLIALARMLQSGTNATAHEVIRTVLRPWLEEARAYYHKMLRSGSSPGGDLSILQAELSESDSPKNIG